MSWLDIAIIGVVLGSIVWGVWRGLVREVMSLAGWVIAFLAANAVGAQLGEMLPASAGSPEVRVLIGFIVVFVVTVAAATLVGVLVSKMFKAAGLIVILLAVAIAAGMTALPRHALWKESVGAGMLERTVLQLKPWLPPALSQRLKYN